jgi:carbon-monoxide dehydrogenase medium subunit
MQPSFMMSRSIEKFGYFSPASLEEALTVLEKYGKNTAILAGGTDVLVDLKFRAIAPEYVMDIKNIAGLDSIEETRDGGLRIGSLATIAKIRESETIKEKYLSLHETTTEAYHSWQIRNLATIGGNICRSSPSADSVPPLLTYEAELKLLGPKGERKVPLEGFMTGPGQNVLDQEILTEVIIPPQGGRYGTAFHSLKRTSVDLCKVNCAVKVVIDNNQFADIKIALGAVAPTAVRAKTAEEALRGKEVNDKKIEEAAKNITEDISPVTDGRSTAEYRRDVSQVITKRVIMQAVERAR